MQHLKLTATKREKIGTRYAKRLRQRGQLPVIIYGHGEAPEAVALSAHDVFVELDHGAHVLELEMNGSSGQFLIKDVQYDHLGTTPVHLDLMRVDMNERVKVEIGIELRGTPKGVNAGGVLEQYMASIEVDCMVTDIPDSIRPLVTELDIDQALLVKDLALPPGVTTEVDPEDRVAAVHLLAEEAEVEEPAEGEEAAQPEVITKGKKDDEEGDD